MFLKNILYALSAAKYSNMSQPHPMCCPCSSLYSLYISITSVEWPFPSIFLCALDGSDEDSFHLSSSCWCSLLGSKKTWVESQEQATLSTFKSPKLPQFWCCLLFFHGFSCMFVIVCDCLCVCVFSFSPVVSKSSLTVRQLYPEIELAGRHLSWCSNLFRSSAARFPFPACFKRIWTRISHSLLRPCKCQAYG